MSISGKIVPNGAFESFAYSGGKTVCVSCLSEGSLIYYQPSSLSKRDNSEEV